MKIVSWNVCCDNGDPRGVEQLIAETNPDVLCLQEVSEPIKRHIESMGDKYPYVTWAIDHYSHGLLGLSKSVPSYLATLSRFPFEEKPIRFKHRRSKTRIALAYFRGWHECIEHQGINILEKNAKWKILNIHVACADTVANKRAQFKRAVPHRDMSAHTVVCGDLNIIPTPEIKHLAKYLMRRIVRTQSLRDLPLGHEQKMFAQMFDELGLHDLFKDQVTHPDSGIALDKILIPKTLVSKCSHEMLTETLGSDHRPLTIDIDP